MIDDWQGFRCICGEQVVAVHSGCKALMTPAEYRQFIESLNRIKQ